MYLKWVNDIIIDFIVMCIIKSIFFLLFVEYVNNIIIYVLLFNLCLILEKLNVKGKNNLIKEYIIMFFIKIFMIWNDVIVIGNLV